MLNTKIKQSGFTIVELLIVIVVIAILAAISIVAYNGIQNRGKSSAAQTAANSLDKKMETYNALNSQYPNTAGTITGTATQGTVTTATSSEWYSPSSATATQSTVLPTTAPTASNATSMLWYFPTPSSTVGGCIYYWDFQNNRISAPITTGIPTTPCTTTPAASGTFPLTNTTATAV